MLIWPLTGANRQVAELGIIDPRLSHLLATSKQEISEEIHLDPQLGFELRHGSARYGCRRVPM